MGQITAFDLQDFIDAFSLTSYVETGTGEGVSLDYAIEYPFANFYTIDIDGELISSVKERVDKPNVEFIHNYSTKALEELLPKLDNSGVLFFLDAHFPGADFHKISYEESMRRFREDAFPLQQELEIINKHRANCKDVIIIDDFILYEPEGDYETIKQGVVWKYHDLQQELNLVTESSFIYKMFEQTHNITKDTRHQGYLILTPKA